MNRNSYWLEAVLCANEDLGIVMTEQQAKDFARDMETSHEHYSLGFPTPENPLERENDNLKHNLKREREAAVCGNCRGGGYTTENAPGINRSSKSKCYKCNGSGKIYRTAEAR